MLPEPIDLSALANLACEERERPFDLSRPPLLRVRLVALSADRHAWIWTQHHIIADGRAQECLLAELADLYRRLADQPQLKVREDPTYRDALDDSFAARQQGQGFWTDYLAHLDTSSLFEPAMRAHGISVSAELSIEMNETDSTMLAEAFAKAQLTAASAFAAWFALSLCVSFERRDLLVGLVTSGRHSARSRFADTVGNLISTVPLRATLNRGRTMQQWMRGIQRGVAEVQLYEATSLQEIKRWIDWPAAQALFDAIFVHENYAAPDALFADAADLHIEHSKFYINEGYPIVFICEAGSRLRLTLRYQPHLCSDDLARALLDRISRLRNAWLADTTRDVFDMAVEIR